MLTSLPCCHAISCMKSIKFEIESYVPEYYKKQMYEACYASVIFLINGESLWKKKGYVELQPPPIKRQPRRPKKKRTRDASKSIRDETQLKRANFGIKCSRCHMMGHNKEICIHPGPNQTTQPEPSQFGPTQPEASQPDASLPALSQPDASLYAPSQSDSSLPAPTQLEAT
ncbi:unnamed protein product [Lathyrus sativus]|nr:unnamed protein product [Lathyrus sativus]